MIWIRQVISASGQIVTPGSEASMLAESVRWISHRLAIVGLKTGPNGENLRRPYGNIETRNSNTNN